MYGENTHLETHVASINMRRIDCLRRHALSHEFDGYSAVTNTGGERGWGSWK